MNAMNDDELRLLLEAFLSDATECLQELEQTLLAMEQEPDGEAVDALFRAAHTLKGNAGCMGYDRVSEVAHAMEDVFDAMREHTLASSRELVSTLLSGVDVLREAIDGAVNGATSPTSRERELVAALRRLAATHADDVVAPVGHAAEGPRVRNGNATLRVGLEKLDRLLDLTGEIAIARGRVGEMLERGEPAERILEVFREADRYHAGLQELVTRVRMVPLGPLFRQHARTVRDLCAATGKAARLVIEGEDVEVDTALVEHLRDPLTQLVRNAVAHGIEEPDTRRECGKGVEGTIRIAARHEGASIVIAVSDDGRGLDATRIAGRARELGLLGEDVAPSERDLASLVFRAGVTTAAEVTELAGRGVGMDVVRQHIEAARGNVSLTSVPGEGTTITIVLPLTLAMIDGFNVGVGSDTFVLPLDCVVECLELPRDHAPDESGAGWINLRGNVLPYLRVRELFGCEGGRPARENIVVVRGAGGRRAGLVVDHLAGTSAIVVKPLGPAFAALRGISGSAVLGTGRVALILDIVWFLDRAASQAASLSASLTVSA
jgi:two-component system chemotaxis sensor kinase CheA